MNRARFPRLVVATRNPGKLRELADGLNDFDPPLRLSAVSEWPESIDVEETGATCRENARLKALAALAVTGLPSLADDTALEVDALGGAPGVHSARYAGPDGNPAANIRKLLEALEGVPDSRRTARFRCVLALALPGSDEPEYVEGVVEGSISRQPRGDGGFGYDPIFVVTEVGRSMAELSPAEKSTLSHRARALHELRRRL